VCVCVSQTNATEWSGSDMNEIGRSRKTSQPAIYIKCWAISQPDTHTHTICCCDTIVARCPRELLASILCVKRIKSLFAWMSLMNFQSNELWWHLQKVNSVELFRNCNTLLLLLLLHHTMIARNNLIDGGIHRKWLTKKLHNVAKRNQELEIWVIRTGRQLEYFCLCSSRVMLKTFFCLLLLLCRS